MYKKIVVATDRITEMTSIVRDLQKMTLKGMQNESIELNIQKLFDQTVEIFEDRLSDKIKRLKKIDKYFKEEVRKLAQIGGDAFVCMYMHYFT